MDSSERIIPPLNGTNGHVPEQTIEKLMPGDWTADEEPANLTDFQKFARNVDWSKSPIGPMRTWSTELRRTLIFLMVDPRPASLTWGPQRVAFYNEHYVPILGRRHPQFFGQPFSELFPGQDDFEKIMRQVDQTGQAVAGSDETSFYLERHGYLEETFFSWTLIPLHDETGLFGMYNPVSETTRTILSQRRTALLIKLGDMTSKTIEDFWLEAARALAAAAFDIPFAATYTTEDPADSSGSSASSHASFSPPKHIQFKSVVGLVKDNDASRRIFEVTSENESLVQHLHKAAETNDIVFLDCNAFPDLDKVLCRPHKDKCRGAVILPVRPTTRDYVGGFVLIGLNPRRPWDSDHQVFVRLVSRLLDTSMAAAFLIEEEVRKSQTAAKRAAIEQAKLQEQLRLTHSRNRRLEMQFPAFASKAPVGISMYTPKGEIIFANDEWFNMIGFSRENTVPMAWMSCVCDDEVPRAQRIFQSVLLDKITTTFEIRFKKRWIPPLNPEDGSGETTDTTVLVSAYPELEEDGSVDALVSCIMNISQQKWSEGLQKKRTEEALASKRLQEAFIDMTSHEMRNPLGAVIHCCDDIIMSLEGEAAEDGKHEVTKEGIANALDAAKTILHCSIHQKRIVDDILTLSKLDSDLLPISPVNVRLLSVVQETLSMFQVEMKNADIQLQLETESTFQDMAIDRVYIDPSRLTQVFINLLTNAIKFTQTEKQRRITVRMGASRTVPTKDWSSGAEFLKSKDPPAVTYTSATNAQEGEPLYLLFSVDDTGRGLSKEEMSNLFQRFTQASPKTHIQYGGSGLGLFICKTLSEKQGGSIGVESESGKGSTFAFYVSSKRAPSIKGETSLPVLESPQHKGIPEERLDQPMIMAEGPKISIIQSATAEDTLKKAPPMDPEYRFPVLLVEDNVVNRKVFSKQLRKLCFPIYEANHGQEALDFLRTTKLWAGRENDGTALEAILMDVEMPVMDGLTCTRHIRKFEADGTITKHIAIISVTANARQEQVDTCLEAGMDAVVCKPFRIPELVEKMQAVRQKLGLIKKSSP